MELVTLTPAPSSDPADWEDLPVHALTPVQRVQSAVWAAKHIEDLRERTAALHRLNRAIAGTPATPTAPAQVGIQAESRTGLTDTLVERVQAGERKVDLANEIGVTPTRIKQLVAGNERSEDAKANAIARRATFARIAQAVDAVQASTAPPRPDRLEARKVSRRVEMARRVSQLRDAQTARPDATPTELAAYLTGTLGEHINRQTVTAWLVAAKDEPASPDTTPT